MTLNIPKKDFDKSESGIKIIEVMSAFSQKNFFKCTKNLTVKINYGLVGGNIIIMLLEILLKNRGHFNNK